jgi:Ca2+-binding RTX toxin-like protein
MRRGYTSEGKETGETTDTVLRDNASDALAGGVALATADCHDTGHGLYCDCHPGVLCEGTNLAEGEVITGSPSSDRLYAYAGHDEIYGEEGNDRIDAGSGNDYIYEGDDSWSGDDVLIGRAGKDQIYGGGGYDRCYGNGGADYLDPETLGVNRELTTPTSRRMPSEGDRVGH